MLSSEKIDKNIAPIIAICYDFDRTLSPCEMQTQGFVQSLGYSAEDFWQECNNLADTAEMDPNLSYMFMMIEKSKGKLKFTKQMLNDFGKKICLFDGLDGWFDRINAYGENRGVKVEHYVLSSGLKEMIEGTPIAKNLTKIYASSFLFSDNGEAIWPAQVINYTNKTQFLFRISKGVLDINDVRVNDYQKDGKFRIPFTNMVYIGDSDTDVPCMKLINVNGGYSVGVYSPKTNDKRKVKKMLEDKRISCYAPADYKENSELDILIKNIIDNASDKG